MRAAASKPLLGCSVLVSAYYLQGYSGSELVTSDLAAYFVNRGARVTVAAAVADTRFYETVIGSAVEVVDLLRNPGPLRERRFDLLWGHHWPVVGYLDYELNVLARVRVLSSLSPYEPLECFPLPVDRADALVFNSAENLRTQWESLPVNARERARIIPNPVSAHWHAEEPGGVRRDALGRLLVVSNHPPPEVLSAVQLLQQSGMQVKVLGHQNEPRLLEPPDVDAHDAVLTIGHTVQKALVRGRPVFCYDRFGGPGWLTARNVERASEFNYSGRCSAERLGPGEIVDRLRAGFRAARDYAQQARPAHRLRYSQEAHLDAMLAELDLVRRVRQSMPFRGPQPAERLTPRKLVLLHLKLMGFPVDWIPAVP